MPRYDLGGAYQASSLIAGAQRRVNLYAETDSKGIPVKSTLFPRPGLTPLGAGSPVIGAGRALYAATNGDLYGVVNQTIYYIDPDFVWHPLVVGLLTPGTDPVSIADNGQEAIVVDGTAFGVSISLAARTSQAISDPNFLGGNRVTFLNFFLLLNELNSPNFYSTDATTITFNALSFGSLTQFPGNVVGLIASEAALWIFSQYKGEVWSDAGTSPFAFQPLSGIIIEYGLAGDFALNRQDTAVYWLAQSPEGGRMAMRGVGNAARRISTHAIEKEWLKYPRVDDCVVTCYQIVGHSFICFDFPTADRTWVFDEASPEDPWHEEAYFDTNGVQHRTKDLFKAYAYGKNLALDWQTGALYQKDVTNFSDNGVAVVYMADMPHMVDAEDDRLTVWRVIADVECGNGTGLPVPQIGRPWSLGFNAGFGPRTLIEPPFMTLYVSHDRGKSFYAHSDQLMAGQYGYNTRPTFNRCGIAFDTVLRFQWSGPFQTSMNAPFVTTEESEADA
jgi:hypothetical protein